MKKTRSIFILIALTGLLFLGGCGTDDIDISAYQDASVSLEIKAGESTESLTSSSEKKSNSSKEIGTITIADLKEMDCVTIKTHSTSDKIGEVRATGPLLETVLRQYGLSQKECKKIRIYGKDDYDITLSSKFLGENDIIMAFGIDGEPLDEESAPLRIIIPESDSAYWIRMVTQIEVVK